MKTFSKATLLRRTTASAFVIVALLAIAKVSHAVSFECKDVTRAIDKAICASPKVLALDAKLANLYRSGMQEVIDKRGLAETQRLWIRKVRDKCTNEQCLIAAYDNRIDQLMPGSGGWNMVEIPERQAKFYRQSVWGIGPSMQKCKPFDSGAPSAHWSNGEPTDIRDSVSANGQVLTRIGTYSDRTTEVYRFFVRKDECMELARSEHVAQAASGTGASVLSTAIGESKANIERKVGRFSFCGSLQGSDMCTATNTLLAVPPITMADGDLPCMIGKDVSFTFDRSGHLKGVVCEVYPKAWTKIRSAMELRAGRGNKEVKQFMGMVSEITSWSTASATTTLTHDSGANVRGEKIDSYSVLIDAAR
jgi:uncharacterized protein YecT (DUF1311 family)